MKIRTHKRVICILMTVMLLVVLAGCTTPEASNAIDSPSTSTLQAQTTSPAAVPSTEPEPEFGYPMEGVSLSINLPEWDPSTIETYIDPQYYFWNQLEERTGVELVD